MKICKVCKESKPLEEFRKHSRAKDGHTNICKQCKINEKTHRCTKFDREGEVWKNIPGIEGAYVSNFGRAKSVTDYYGERLLTPQVYKKKNFNAPKRLRVMFDRRKQGGKAHYIFLAREVCKLFVAPLPSKNTKIIHRDGDTLNCSAFNLAWSEGYDTFADHMTKAAYSKMNTPLGIAAFKYFNGDRSPLDSTLAVLEKSITRRVSGRFRLSALEASEAYWDVVNRFIQKLPTGTYKTFEEQEKVLFLLVRETARYKNMIKFKEVSIHQTNREGEEINMLDKIASSDFWGGNDIYDEGRYVY